MDATGDPRVALLGYGYWGPNLARNLHLRLGRGWVACVDPDPARRAEVAHRYPWVRVLAGADGVLSRGLLGGRWAAGQAAASGDMRARMPRFHPENRQRNLALVEALGEIAEAKGVTVAQLAIAWVLARGPDIIPLVDTTRRDRLAEAVDAVGLELSVDDLTAIERAPPAGAVAGDR